MTELYKLEQHERYFLNNPSKWSIQGTSKAGERTGFLLSPLKIILDGGVTSSIKPLAVFNTHSHCDHTLALPTLFGPRLNPIKGQEELIGRPLYLPKNAEFPIQKLMESAVYLSDNNPEFEDNIDYAIKENVWKRQGYQPMVVKPMDIFRVPGIEKFQVEVLKAYHNTESIGYGFSTINNKLKKEYIDTTSQQKIEAKENGIVITDEILTPELVFFCDSTIDNLKKHDEWKKYPVIISECTGFPEMKNYLSNNTPHTYLYEIEEVIREHRDKEWILIHSSSSSKRVDLDKHQERLNQDGLKVRFI